MPIALTAVLLALLAAGIAVALVTLLDTPESAPPATTVTVPGALTPTTSTPTTSVPSATTPGATVPTVPTTSAPGATTPGTTTPSGTTTQSTFTIPGTRIRLPANATP